MRCAGHLESPEVHFYLKERAPGDATSLSTASQAEQQNLEDTPPVILRTLSIRILDCSALTTSLQIPGIVLGLSTEVE